MKLKELIAEYHYLKNVARDGYTPFCECDSNVRDHYHKIAGQEIPNLITFGYLKDTFFLTKCINGAIKSYIKAHGNTLTLNNYGSLTKRILNAIKDMQRNKNAQKEASNNSI